MADLQSSERRMILIELRLSDEELDRIASRIVELGVGPNAPSADTWVDVPGAASHLGLTPLAVRALVKRGRIPVHRTESNRLRFSLAELDHWVRAGSCEPTNEDLP